MIDTETAVIDDKNAQLQFVLNQFDPEKNEGIWQEGIGKIYFIPRKAAAPTIVTCQVVGIVGTVIPAGSLVQDDSNNLYETMDEFTITSPSPMDLDFRCTVSGPIECPADHIHRIFSQISGWDTVGNEAVGITGNLEETRTAFERRRYDTVAKNAHGTISSLYGSVANLNDVISVAIEENDTSEPQVMRGVTVGPHGFFISVVGASNEDIAWSLYERKDGGCAMYGNTQVTIYVPTRTPTTRQPKMMTFNRPSNIRCQALVTIRIDPRTTAGNIDALIAQRIVDAWNGVGDYPRVEIGESVYASRFYCPLNAIDTPYYLVSVQLRRETAPGSGMFTDWADQFDATLDEYPTIVLADISVVGV